MAGSGPIGRYRPDAISTERIFTDLIGVDGSGAVFGTTHSILDVAKKRALGSTAAYTIHWNLKKKEKLKVRNEKCKRSQNSNRLGMHAIDVLLSSPLELREEATLPIPLGKSPPSETLVESFDSVASAASISCDEKQKNDRR